MALNHPSLLIAKSASYHVRTKAMSARRRLLVTFLTVVVLSSSGVVTLALRRSQQSSPPPPARINDALVFPAADWAAATPESQGLDSGKLEAGLKSINYAGNVVIIRNGYLVKTKGSPSDSAISIYSATKSLTALVFARLLQQGKVSYDELLPRSDYPTGPRASFRHFLTMTSDYDLTPHQPGRHYAYNNSAIRFYGEHMRMKFFPAETAAGVIKAMILDSIGGQDTISIDPAPGVKGTPWAGGQRISARDMARMGLLVLAGGVWKDKQIIPTEFCNALFKNQIPDTATISTSPGTVESGTNTESNQQEPSRGLKGNYSFGWWCNENGRFGSDVPREITYASGRGGNYIIVIRPWNVVIAVTNNEPERRPRAEAYIKVVSDALISQR